MSVRCGPDLTTSFQEPVEVAILGEGGEEGRIKAGKSVVFAILEVKYYF